MKSLKNEPPEHQIEYIKFAAEIFKDCFNHEKERDCIEKILIEFEQNPQSFFVYKDKYEIADYPRFATAYVSWASIISHALPNFYQHYKNRIQVSQISFFQQTVEPFIYAFYICQYPKEAKIKDNPK